MTRIFVGITGASGHAYTRALVRSLLECEREVDLALTEAGVKVMRHEMGVDPGPRGRALAEEPGLIDHWLGVTAGGRVRVFGSDAVEAPPSSGTSLTGGVVLCPCSMGTLARVSVGFSSNLVERAADVAMKEGRKLIVVPRETPLSEIHLENMLRMARLGATVLPAMPGFYHHAKSLEDLVDHVVGKILDRLEVEHSVGARWKGIEAPPEDEGPGRSGAGS